MSLRENELAYISRPLEAGVETLNDRRHACGKVSRRTVERCQKRAAVSGCKKNKKNKKNDTIPAVVSTDALQTAAETERPCVLCCHSHRPSLWLRQTAGCFHREELLTTAVGGTRWAGPRPLRAQGHPIRKLLGGYWTGKWICDFLQHLIRFFFLIFRNMFFPAVLKRTRNKQWPYCLVVAAVSHTTEALMETVAYNLAPSDILFLFLFTVCWIFLVASFHYLYRRILDRYRTKVIRLSSSAVFVS